MVRALFLVRTIFPISGKKIFAFDRYRYTVRTVRYLNMWIVVKKNVNGRFQIFSEAVSGVLRDSVLRTLVLWLSSDENSGYFHRFFRALDRV